MSVRHLVEVPDPSDSAAMAELSQLSGVMLERCIEVVRVLVERGAPAAEAELKRLRAALEVGTMEYGIRYSDAPVDGEGLRIVRPRASLATARASARSVCLYYDEPTAAEAVMRHVSPWMPVDGGGQ